MAEGLMTWLDKVAMVPSVVMGVTREALELSTVPPARLLDTVPVTVPRVVTPARTTGDFLKRPFPSQTLTVFHCTSSSEGPSTVI